MLIVRRCEVSRRRLDDAFVHDLLSGAAKTRRRFGYRWQLVALRRDGQVYTRKCTQRLTTRIGHWCVCVAIARGSSAQGHRS